MKVKKSKIITEENSFINICKKCGEPLRSTNKNKYCDNCRRERGTKGSKILGTFGGVCVLGLLFSRGKHSNNEE